MCDVNIAAAKHAWTILTHYCVKEKQSCCKRTILYEAVGSAAWSEIMTIAYHRNVA